MKRRDALLSKQLEKGLENHRKRRSMPGISGSAEEACLLEQLIESVRRVLYPGAIQRRDVAPARLDPSSEQFDPLKAAILCQKRGKTDEAFWLVFLFVQFGRSSRSGYRLARDVYAGNGSGGPWTWARLSSDIKVFAAWFAKESATSATDGVARGFGAHRGHETLRSSQATIESYVGWVNPPRSHTQLVGEAQQAAAGSEPGKTFNHLYRSMSVYRFGRLAKFDYLAMVGKLGLADIEPDGTYVREATGPLKGARLLYCGDKTDDSRDAELEQWLLELGADLGVGQQVVEDAICNWRKSPGKFRMFRG